VIQDFARMVSTPTRLDYLYLLTVADMRGTNPARWNSWKASLLDHLHTRTIKALERGLDQPQQQDEVITQRQAEARIQLIKKGLDNDQLNLLWMSLSTDYFLQNSVDAIVWHTQLLWPPDQLIEQTRVELRYDERHRCTDIFVYGPDRDDLFAHTTALLDQLSLNVLSARIQTTSAGLSINSYLVLEDVLEPELLGRLRAETDQVVARSAAVTENNDIYDLEDTHTPEAPRVRRIKVPHTVMTAVDELVRSPVIGAIVVAVDQTAGGITEIAEQTEAQSSSAEQVQSAIKAVSETTESGAVSAEQLAASAEELGAQAQSLQDLASQFNL